MPKHTMAYAAQMPLRMAGTNPERDKTGDYVLNAHSVVVDGAMRAFRKMEQSQEKDRKPSIRGRLNGSPQSERKNPEKTKEQQKKRGNQCEL